MDIGRIEQVSQDGTVQTIYEVNKEPGRLNDSSEKQPILPIFPEAAWRGHFAGPLCGVSRDDEECHGSK